MGQIIESLGQFTGAQGCYAIGVATGGTTTSITSTGLSADWANKRAVFIYDGSGKYAKRWIKTATTTELTFDFPLEEIPDSTTKFAIGFNYDDLEAYSSANLGQFIRHEAAPIRRYKGVGILIIEGGTVEAPEPGFIADSRADLYIDGEYYFSMQGFTYGAVLMNGRHLADGTGVDGGLISVRQTTTGKQLVFYGSFVQLGGTFQTKPGKQSLVQLANAKDLLEHAFLSFRDCIVEGFWLPESKNTITSNVNYISSQTSWDSPQSASLGETTVLKNKKHIEGQIIIEPGLIQASIHHFDFESLGETFLLSNSGNPVTFPMSYNRGSGSNTYPAYSGVFFWNYKNNTNYPLGQNVNYQIFNYADWDTRCKIYFGFTVNVEVVDIALNPLENAALLLLDTNGNGGWLTSMDAATTLPVRSKTILTNAQGRYVDPITNEPYGLVYATLLEPDNNVTTTSIITTYGPFTFRARLYGYGEINQTITSENDAVELKLFFLTNEKITQSDSAIVAAYPNLSSTFEAYDAIQLYLSDPSRLETDDFVDLTGDMLNLGDKNVILDPSATDLVSEPNSTTVTLKRDTLLVGNITTTGLVTGKEYVDGVVIDSTQDSSLTERNGFDIRVFNPADDSLIYEGSNYAFLFSGLSVNPVKVYVNLEGTWLEIAELITLTQGINEVDSGVAGSIFTLGAKIDTKPTLAEMEASPNLGTDLTPVLDAIAGVETKAEADLRQTVINQIRAIVTNINKNNS